MNSKILLVILLTGISQLSACSKPNANPGDSSKVFLSSVESNDVNKFTASLSTGLQEKIRSSNKNLKGNMAEGSLKVKQCGGYKALTPNYNVIQDATSVEGYTLIEYNGNCPAEKQYLKLLKQNEMWYIDEPGPSVKQ